MTPTWDGGAADAGAVDVGAGGGAMVLLDPGPSSNLNTGRSAEEEIWFPHNEEHARVECIVKVHVDSLVDVTGDHRQIVCRIRKELLGKDQRIVLKFSTGRRRVLERLDELAIHKEVRDGLRRNAIPLVVC